MEAVAALAGGVAHEFNNALAGLMGNLELMEMENTAWQGGREYFEGIKRTCFRMSGLAAKLLAYARGGKYRTQKTTLEQALAGAREVIQETLAEEISLDKRIQGRLKVALDPTQFRFIIKSLLSNAAEATAAGGRIRLRARDATLSQTAATDLHEHFPAGPYACLAITDFGHGMDSETLSRVFDPFFSTRFPGRGLGMAAVYGIVKNHGGWIFIESQPEKGTTVTVYFPAVTETTPGSQPNRECSSKGRPEENSGMSSRPNRDEPDR